VSSIAGSGHYLTPSVAGNESRVSFAGGGGFRFRVRAAQTAHIASGSTTHEQAMKTPT
jgi:hypothetical protein